MAAINERVCLTKWGNSQAVIIPSSVINQLHLTDDQEFILTIQDKSIVLTPVLKRPRDIHELFAGWQDDGNRDTGNGD